jgi:hypothetical protein
VHQAYWNWILLKISRTEGFKTLTKKLRISIPCKETCIRTTLATLTNVLFFSFLLANKASKIYCLKDKRLAVVSCHACDSSALSPRLSKETEPSHPTFPSVLMSRCLHSLLIIQMKWRNPNPSSEGVFVLNHKISIQTISCFMTGKTFKLLLTMQDFDWC